MSGIHIVDVKKTLDAIPELFLRVPRRGDGLTRYALTTATAARSAEAVEKLVVNSAKRESWFYYAIILSILAVVLYAVIALFPSFIDVL